MILILLEVASKPNICMLTPPKPGNDHAHGLELRISSKGCAVDATMTIYGYVQTSIPGVKFRIIAVFIK